MIAADSLATFLKAEEMAKECVESEIINKTDACKNENITTTISTSTLIIFIYLFIFLFKENLF